MYAKSRPQVSRTNRPERRRERPTRRRPRRRPPPLDPAATVEPWRFRPAWKLERNASWPSVRPATTPPKSSDGVGRRSSTRYGRACWRTSSADSTIRGSTTASRCLARGWVTRPTWPCLVRGRDDEFLAGDGSAAAERAGAGIELAGAGRQVGRPFSRQRDKTRALRAQRQGGGLPPHLSTSRWPSRPRHVLESRGRAHRCALIGAADADLVRSAAEAGCRGV